MSEHQLQYVEEFWGGLPAFLETYISVDRQVRQNIAPSSDSNVENFAAVAQKLISNAENSLAAKVHALAEDCRAVLPGGPMFETILQHHTAGEHNRTERNRADFLADLTAKLQDGLLSNSLATLLHNLDSDSKSIRNGVSECLSVARNTLLELSKPINAIHEEVTIHKRKRSAEIGQEAQLKMQYKLDEVFKKSKVEFVGAAGGRTDFMLQTAGQPNVLLELKDWKDKVATRDVKRMEEEVSENCCHAIMTSLRSGVVERGDFEFRVIDNRYVALYLTNVQWDMTKVQAAVNLVYSLDEILKAGQATGNYIFTPDLIDSMSGEVHEYQEKIRTALKLVEQTKNTLLAIPFDNLRLKLAKGVRVEAGAASTTVQLEVGQSGSKKQWRCTDYLPNVDCDHAFSDRSYLTKAMQKYHKAAYDTWVEQGRPGKEPR